jgi:hypothetical protein
VTDRVEATLDASGSQGLTVHSSISGMPSDAGRVECPDPGGSNVTTTRPRPTSPLMSASALRSPGRWKRCGPGIVFGEPTGLGEEDRERAGHRAGDDDPEGTVALTDRGGAVRVAR